ncbi:CBU_0592 family membrane protein [Caldimonas tepidiphila]|uniref:CBU_0592 family membrane protein n=1 Tax=Caldimonas tepidiphila TaxID=2315841 RepID=UPI000E5B1872|nr:hypothetical protein [Caldimonas tepidiphila]
MIAINLTTLIGLVGVAAYIAAHFIVQVLHKSPRDKVAVALNILGPICVLISLADAFNIASFLTQCFWLGLTVVGWWREKKAVKNGS